MTTNLTNNFDEAMKKHIWLDGVALNQLSTEDYKKYLTYTLKLDHHEDLRLYRGGDGDLAPGIVASVEQMDVLISYLEHLRAKM